MDADKTFQPIREEDIITPPLTDPDEIRAAIDDLVHVQQTSRRYTKINRAFIDPEIPEHPTHCLFSYVQCDLGDGVMGVGKIRGAYRTKIEAIAASEKIIRDVDSQHSVFIIPMGHPFALIDRGFSREVNEIDLEDKVNGAMERANVEQRKKDKAEMEDMMKREKRLRDECENGSPMDSDPFEIYIRDRVKLAQLEYTISEHVVKRRECVVLKNKCLNHLRQTAAEHPEFEKDYLERYMQARRNAHFPESTDGAGFMKYMKVSIGEIVEDDLSLYDNEPVRKKWSRRAIGQDEVKNDKRVTFATAAAVDDESKNNDISDVSIGVENGATACASEEMME